MTNSKVSNSEEIWKPVAGYEGSYEVSNLGRVRSLDRVITAQFEDRVQKRRLKGRILRRKWAGSRREYAQVALYCDSRKNDYRYIHDLVAEAFIGPKPDDKQVNHKNLDKSDNRVSNLEYVTASENIRHAIRNGVQFGAIGEHHRDAKLTEDDVRGIFEGWENGEPQQSLADQFGVDESHISKIVTGKKWRHLGLYSEEDSRAA